VLNSSNARRLVQFYEGAFGAEVRGGGVQRHQRFAGKAGMKDGGERTALRLGDASIELVEFDYPGRPYPFGLSPYDTRFQHLAIVVTNMLEAMQRLHQIPGWQPISIGGPQRLPESDGGVTAFKFRDPEGHPLEFLEFAAGKMPAHWQDRIGSGVHLGIDHSALSVADPARSVQFYESLNLTQSNRSLNQGSAQAQLDGVPAPMVDVISLVAQDPTPHVELLHYRTRSREAHEALHSQDVAATRLVFASPNLNGEPPDRIIQDPDGHFLQFENVVAIEASTT
jgi:catechol 2,3-dioxygenase-like lactoylglutathione lyase family enzyme